jgi:hypothetical protein
VVIFLKWLLAFSLIYYREVFCLDLARWGRIDIGVSRGAMLLLFLAMGLVNSSLDFVMLGFLFWSEEGRRRVDLGLG